VCVRARARVCVCVWSTNKKIKKKCSERTCTFKYDRMISEILWHRFFFYFCCVYASELAFQIAVLSPFAMTTLTHYSPSRSSLSCCQFDRSSQDDMRSSAIIGNNNYFLQRKKHSFPKRPEIDLSFRDIRYRVKEWSIRNFSVSKYT